MIQFKTKSASLISALLCVLATPVLAQSGDTTERGAGAMTGYQETPAAVNSPGSGEFFIHIHPDRTGTQEGTHFKRNTHLLLDLGHMHQVRLQSPHRHVRQDGQAMIPDFKH